MTRGPAERYYRRGMRRVWASGFTEQRVEIDGWWTNYAEGPDNGPPLVLVHGQASRWQDHLHVLPSLAERHHVFAVDVYGHGRSARLPPDRYTNRSVAALLAGFLRTVVGRPAVLAGHSSGALLAADIAARHPECVRALILEDPPFFSSIPPRAHRTVGGDLARVSDEFRRQREESDFPRYFLRRSALFDLFGPLRRIVVWSAVRFRDRHPARPVQLWFAPKDLNIFLRGLEDFDPAFGAAWRDGSWYRGFETEAALAAITAPTALIHANFWFHRFGSYYNRHGVLMAAMDDHDLERTISLIGDPDVTAVPIGHLVHFLRPETYLRVIADLEHGVDGASRDTS